jgi:hypothetical protein
VRLHVHPTIGIGKIDFSRRAYDARLDREREFLNGPEDSLFA